MAVYTIQAPDGRKIRIEAPDEATAIRGAEEWTAANPAQQAAPAQAHQTQATQADENGIAIPPPNLPPPGSREYADWAAQAVRAGLKVPHVGPQSLNNVRDVESDWLDPVLQGATMGWGDELAGTIKGGVAAAQGGDFGKTYDQTRENLLARYEHEKYVNPLGSMAGEVGGALATAVPSALATGGGSVVGAGGNLLTRMLGAGAVGGAQSAVYGAGQSDGNLVERAPDALQAGKEGAAISAAIPVVGSAVRAGVGAISDRVGPLVNSIFRPTAEAERRVGTAVLRDQSANPGMIVSQADEAVARQADIPLLNVDRGGETTRALARSAANQSPETRQVIEKAANDRFAGQGDRATQIIKRISGGNVDDVGTLDALKRLAESGNSIRYKSAYKAPQAAAIWTPEIRQLMQAGPFRAAIEGAESTAANDAAVSGVKAVRNPFQFGPDGGVTLRTMPDGSRALPSLQFWDIVQRNLRAQSEQAARQGNNLLASQISAMRRQLNSTLDTAVPQFQQARQGAAAFFGAEDALEAGRKFATTPRAIPEARQAFAKLSDAEKKLFATGYASELVDRVKATRDRVNVINSMFGTQASREMNELVFGKARAQELEAYVRVENLADLLRGAMGNSTTARQLVELGIGAVGGGVPAFAISGGDWRAALAGAAGVRGARFVVGKANDRVMQEVGKLLTSGKRADLDRAISNAMLSEKWMDAVKSFTQTVEAVTRSAVPPVVSDQRQGAQPAPAFQ